MDDKRLADVLAKEMKTAKLLAEAETNLAEIRAKREELNTLCAELESSVARTARELAALRAKKLLMDQFPEVTIEGPPAPAAPEANGEPAPKRKAR